MSIKLRNVTVDYGNFIAVNNLSIDIKTGEMAALLGPSGCGKSTTLNAIAGLIQVTSGQILFDGIDVTHKTTQKRNIGLVFQNYALYPHLSVFQNIAFPLYQSKSFKKSVKLNNNKVKLNKLILKISNQKRKLFHDLHSEIEYYDNYVADIKNQMHLIEDSYIKESNIFLLEFISEMYKSEKYEIFKNKQFSFLFDKMKLYFSQKHLEVFKEIKKQFIEKVDLLKKEKKPTNNSLIKLFKKIESNLNFREVEKLNSRVKMFENSLKEHVKSIDAEYKLAIENAKKNNTEFVFELNDDEYRNKLEEFESRSLETKNKLDLEINNKIASNLEEKINNLFEKIIFIFNNNDDETLMNENEIFEFNKLNQIISFKKSVRENVNDVASKVEIQDQLHKKPFELSGGQQQRVAIARSIIKKPKILLLDEPLSNLDAKLRVTTREWIKRFQKETGITTIFVTHDQEEALSISDKIFVMSKGVLQQDDEPIKIYECPKNLFVANFIGTPSMNFIKCNIGSNGEIKIFGQEINKKSKFKNKNVVLGIRPEHIKIKDDISNFVKLNKAEFQGSIVNFELLGKSNYIKLKIDNFEIGIVYDSQIKKNLEYEEEISFNFIENNLFIYDDETKELLEVI